jgi:hypothetical protein
MPEWGNFQNDSGGECGVPVSKRFQMPQQSKPSSSSSSSPAAKANGVFWYSYGYATVHTIVISSEHDLNPGSPQYTWLEADLARVDRRVVPWIILESHRPLYEGETGEHWWNSIRVGQAMRKEFEELLKEYKVDVVLSGHYHEYHRTCDGVFKGTCHSGGPIHITVGSAGATLDDGSEFQNEWTAKWIRGEYGYGRITVANASAMQFEFVRAGPRDDSMAGQVDDEIWIRRDRS